nr:MAG TPA: hypothetical protein [Caudoviricetes sp.]
MQLLQLAQILIKKLNEKKRIKSVKVKQTIN